MPGSRRARNGTALALCLAVATGVAAQFRSGIEKVVVTVTVTDSNGRLITGLSRDDFEVFEDGDPQPVTQFTDARLPVSLGILLDVSDSMRGQAIVDARRALDRFVGVLLEPGDEVFVQVFNHEPRLVARWTRPPSGLVSRLDMLLPTGGTAMYDALATSVPLLESRQHERAALVVISDGADTASDRTILQARDALRRADAFVYAIALDRPGTLASTAINPNALRDLTNPSGGYTEVVRSGDELAPATARIANELDMQYTLAYTPQRPLDGEWRSIRVRATNSEYLARARRGYFADPPTVRRRESIGPE